MLHLSNTVYVWVIWRILIEKIVLYIILHFEVLLFFKIKKVNYFLRFWLKLWRLNKLHFSGVISLNWFFWSTQANVVCVVYDVTNEDTITKVFTRCLFYSPLLCGRFWCLHVSSLTLQIRTRWIPLVNGDAEKGNKYVSPVNGCGVCVHMTSGWTLHFVLLWRLNVKLTQDMHFLIRAV